MKFISVYNLFRVEEFDMTLKEEVEYYKKNALALQEMNSKLENDNGALKAKNWNLENKLKDMKTERDRLSKEVDILKDEKKELNLRMAHDKKELSGKVRALEDENRSIKSKAMQLQQVYKEQLNKYREQCMTEIAKARNSNRNQEIINCLNRNNGNKTKTAKELGITRQAIYNCINRGLV